MKLRPHRLFLLGTGVLFLDQTIKFLVRTHPDLVWYAFSPFFGWGYFENTGIAFGLPFPRMLLLVLTVVVLAVLVAWTQKTKRAEDMLGAACILSGAISNLIDRLLFSFTIDYIHIATAVINIADIAIVLGACLLLFPKKKRPNRLLQEDAR